jgi:hypothetical protein
MLPLGGYSTANIAIWKANVKLNRYPHVMFSRLRMCHTYLAHSHHMTRERSLMWDQCNTTTTVAHFLLETYLENDHRKKPSDFSVY